MTTIAYKDGVLVGDKKMSYHSSNVTKVWKLEAGEYKGWLLGGSGSATGILKFKDWVEGGQEPDLPAGYEGANILIDPDGNIQLYINDVMYPIFVEEKFFAVGSGSDYAMGAMAAGASAEEAVGIAAAYDASTGEAVDVLHL